MNYRTITRRVFIGLGAVMATCVLAAVAGLMWLVRRECKRNHSVKGNPVPDDHFRNVIATRFDPPDIYNLDVVTVDSTSAVATWATARRSRFVIEHTERGEGLRWAEGLPAVYHMAELTGLQPDTEYSFHLREEAGGLDEPISFHTLPEAGDVIFTFATFSDNHFKPDGMSWPDGRCFRRCSEIHACLVRDLNRTGADFLINKGDLTDVFERYRLRAYRDAVRGLRLPMHCIPGNHDHLRNKDFTADWVDFSGTDQVYRSFDQRGFHFVLLDTCWTGEQERGYLGQK
ncbi:MAG: metallophosphoesterase, partial [Candidatus Hydrogenedentota bacterium]